eukprot:snap_masked-scaffold_83-processed-gene-0.29-mRNA-1 protein AED:1.00 eAED:1.00 QI:0/-1/0/0/-1/1/1/0/280
MKIPKASQIDALDLNQRINNILVNQFNFAISRISNRNISFFERYRRETKLIVDIFLWLLTFGRNKQTPGDFIHNLKYNKTSSLQKLLHLPISIFLPYFYASSEIKYRLDKYLKLAQLLNFLFFLKYGKFRSLTDRFLRISIKNARLRSPAHLAFDLISQELLFEYASDLLLTFIKLLSSFSLYLSIPKLQNIFPKKNLVLEMNKRKYTLLNNAAKEIDLRRCAFCKKEESNIYTVCELKSCAHLACYSCLVYFQTVYKMRSCPEVACGKTVSSYSFVDSI